MNIKGNPISTVTALRDWPDVLSGALHYTLSGVWLSFPRPRVAPFLGISLAMTRFAGPCSVDPQQSAARKCLDLAASAQALCHRPGK